MPRKLLLFKLIHFSRAIKMSHKKPIHTLSIFLGVNFSQRIKNARMRTINTFARCAMTAFPTVVRVKPSIRKYILRALAPEIVKNSNVVNFRCI